MVAISEVASLTALSRLVMNLSKEVMWLSKSWLWVLAIWEIRRKE
jgi:hypothetical protein